MPQIFLANQCSSAALFRRSFWRDNPISHDIKSIKRLGHWDFWCRFAFFNPHYAILPEPLHLHCIHEAMDPDSIEAADYTEVAAIRNRWSFAAQSALVGSRQGEHNRAKEINVRQSSDLLRKGSAQWLGVQIDILVCQASLEQGGAASFFKNLLKALAERGLRSMVLTTGRDLVDAELVVASYRNADIPVFLNNLCRSDADCEVLLWHLISMHKIKYLVIVGSKLAYEFLQRLRKEFPGLTIIDYLLNPVGHLRSAAKHRDIINLVVAANDEVKAALVERQFPASKVKVIFHGIPIDKCMDTAAKVLSERKAHEDVFRFGFFGRMSSEKRPLDFVRFAEMLDRRPKKARVEFLMVGDGPERENVASEIAKRRLADVIKLEASVDHSCDFYAQIDALVICSVVEGLPLVLLEAMLAGKQIIATKVGAIPKVMAGAGVGYLVSVGDIDAMQHSARSILGLSEAERRTIAIREAECIHQLYTIDRCADEHLPIFGSKGISADGTTWPREFG